VPWQFREVEQGQRILLVGREDKEEDGGDQKHRDERHSEGASKLKVRLFGIVPTGGTFACTALGAAAVAALLFDGRGAGVAVGGRGLGQLAGHGRRRRRV